MRKASKIQARRASPKAPGLFYSHPALKPYQGRKLVLYFYPADDTPGCTLEACEFAKAHAKILKKGAVLVGVSPDSAGSHAKFAEKFGLPFPLVSDEGHKLAEAFGAWVQKSMFGHKFWGVQRSTYIIDKGELVKSWPKVRAAGHAKEVLEAL